MKTTFDAIMKYNPCQAGINEFTKKSGKTSGEVSFAEILESNGILDALWCLRVLSNYHPAVMKFNLLCARRVEHLITTGKAKKFLDVLEMYLDGEASKKELENAAALAALAADAANAHAASVYTVATANADTYATYATKYAAAVNAAYAASATAYATTAAPAPLVAGAAANASADAYAEREYQI